MLYIAAPRRKSRTDDVTHFMIKNMLKSHASCRELCVKIQRLIFVYMQISRSRACPISAMI